MNSTRNYIEFVLDNKIQKIEWNGTHQLSPTTTLLQYLRSLENHKGTKEGCGEGDCGACTVVVAELENEKLVYKAVNSCLIFLPQVHGKQIITVENLAKENTLHPIQSAMVELDASQCGFCTPGFAMSMFALYKASGVTNESEILDAFAGNLCRCTGYKSILNAAHKALGSKTKDQFSEIENDIKQKLRNIQHKNGLFTTELQQYYAPKSLTEALTIKKNNNKITVIGGASDVALRVTKKKEIIPQILDLSHISELNFINKTSQGFEIGSATTLQQLKEAVKSDLPAFDNILSVFGSKQIRQVATLGGNIGSASPIGDTLPLLMAYKAIVTVKNLSEEREFPLTEFITGYRQTQLKEDELITKIFIPIPDSSVHIDIQKISKRVDLDISTVCGVLRLELESDNTIKNINLYYGGMSAVTKGAENTEKFLLSKKWSKETLTEAMPFIEKDFTPIADARSEAEGRMIFAKNLLLKFWENFQK
ncbi:MAG: xanthine dehydrogenase small subunit [Salinivirgaceae bacterium]|nr:xanthine dehydrogenase small subunit [Salinivirgaceae bacterium]